MPEFQGGNSKVVIYVFNIACYKNWYHKNLYPSAGITKKRRGVRKLPSLSHIFATLIMTADLVARIIIGKHKVRILPVLKNKLISTEIGLATHFRRVASRLFCTRKGASYDNRSA